MNSLDGEQNESSAESARQRLQSFAGGLPIFGPDGALVGVITQGDVLRALEHDGTGESTAIEAGSSPAIVAYADEMVLDALHRLLENDIGRLPVVERGNPSKMVGFFDRSSLLNTWTHQLDEENVREHGWLAAWGKWRSNRNGHAE